MGAACRRYYVGVAACGCTRLALIDEDLTSATEVADFAKRQAKLGRRMEHVAAEFPWRVAPDCAEHSKESSRLAACGEKGVQGG